MAASSLFQPPPNVVADWVGLLPLQRCHKPLINGRLQSIRMGGENSLQAVKWPQDVLFFCVITAMIDRQRNYNLRGTCSSFCSWELHVGTETSPTHVPLFFQRWQHTRGISLVSFSASCPLLYIFHMSSLDWHNESSSSHTGHRGKQIVFPDFPGEFTFLVQL